MVFTFLFVSIHFKWYKVGAARGGMEGHDRPTLLSKTTDLCMYNWYLTVTTLRVIIIVIVKQPRTVFIPSIEQTK